MIPVSQPVIAKNAKKYLMECITSGWVSSQGPFVSSFEEKFAKYLNVGFATTTTSGTAALHIALAALGIGKDDEVIITTFTMIAPVFAILYTGAKPVLVDVDSKTWNMDVTQIEKKITKKTKAIVAVHIYGNPVDMDRLIQLARQFNLALIEDGAEALGAGYRGKKVGTFGDIACFSFYASKLITTGEGGMAVTSNKGLAKRLKLLKDMAYSEKKRFLHTQITFTYRMSNLQAALGLAQLEEIDITLSKKRSVAKLYTANLANLTKLTLPKEIPETLSSYCMYAVLTNRGIGISRDTLCQKLFVKEIETHDFFVPMHRQPVLLKLGLFTNEHYPVADDISKRGFYLPSGPAITKAEVSYVCKALKAIL